MEEKTPTPGLVSRAWNLNRKAFIPAVAAMALYTVIWLGMNIYLFPDNLVINPGEGEISAGFVAKIFAGAGLLGLLSLFSILFVVSLGASRHEGRPWTWAQGFHMALEKVFALAAGVIMIFFQILALTLLFSLITGMILGVKDASQMPLVLTLQLGAAGLLSLLFLVIYCLLPQVLLVEKEPFFFALKRAAFLSKRRRFKILGFLLLCWSPVILLQVYAVLATLGSQLGWSLPNSDLLIQILGYTAQGLGVIITPFFLSGTTALYYEARSREVNLEV